MSPKATSCSQKAGLLTPDLSQAELSFAAHLLLLWRGRLLLVADWAAGTIKVSPCMEGLPRFLYLTGHSGALYQAIWATSLPQMPKVNVTCTAANVSGLGISG